MQGGGGTVRVALAGASLLLLAAAGARFMLLRDPTWVEGTSMWARRLKTAAWAPWHPEPAVGGVLAVPGAAAIRHGQAVHATLHLPDHTELEVGEEATLEELVSMLLAAQGGTRSPSSIELIAVERVIVERPSRLHAAASTLARLLRLPASWQGAGADGGRVSAGALLDALTAAGSSEAGGVVGMPAAVTSAAAAAAEGQRAALPAGEDDEGDEQRLPMTAFDDEYLDDVDSMEQPGRRLMLEAREAGAAAPREEEAWQPVKLFGPRVPALQQLQPVLPRRQDQQAAPTVLRLRVLVVLKQQAISSQASLLNRLATPAQSLGRRAAAGANSGVTGSSGRVRLQGTLSEPVLAQLLALQQQQQGRHPVGPLPAGAVDAGPQVPLLAAVDAIFVGAVLVSLVCTTLLAVDVARYGWRRPSPSQQRDCQQQRSLREALLVVAADEVAAWSAASGKH